jgi:2-oxoglutarate dehydrogenase E2 component (dihydrolipoamide succinyltransferase)
MQYSRVSPIALRLARSAKPAATAALRNMSQVRNLHVQAPAALYTVGYQRSRYVVIVCEVFVKSDG